jgi:hypothetical protein
MCDGWYMTKDGTLLNASEYNQLSGQPKRPPSAPHQQQKGAAAPAAAAAAAGQQGGQRLAAAAAGQQGAHRPGSAPLLAHRPPGPQQKPAAAAVAGAGPAKGKRPSDGGELHEWPLDFLLLLLACQVPGGFCCNVRFLVASAVSLCWLSPRCNNSCRPFKLVGCSGFHCSCFEQVDVRQANWHVTRAAAAHLVRNAT